MTLLHSLHPPPSRLISLWNPNGGRPNIHSRTLYHRTTPSLECSLPQNSSIPLPTTTQFPEPNPQFPQSFCSCGRRRFIAAIATAPFLPIPPISYASASQLQPADMLNQIHPSRGDWYEEFYASVMATEMKSYESEISGYKSRIFADLRGAETVLEIGIGTGPNLKYYAGGNRIRVYGIDPNIKMKKYALEAANLAGLSTKKFEFIPAVAEALPLDTSSVDAVIGTLVLCSVQNVDAALQEIMRVLKPGGQYLFVEHVAAEDGSILRFIQGILDPLQQVVADGCHLTRNTGKHISEAGFSKVKMNTTFLKNASLISPHIFGVAFK